MSWFTEFLADTARQAAPGIHQAINSDIQRKQRLGELEQTIPILVKQQRALMPGAIEEAQKVAEAKAHAASIERRANVEAWMNHPIIKQIIGQTQAQPEAQPSAPPSTPVMGPHFQESPEFTAAASKVMSAAPTLGKTLFPQYKTNVRIAPGSDTPVSFTMNEQTEPKNTPHYSNAPDGSMWVVDSPGAEPRMIRGPMKSAQPQTAELNNLIAVQAANNPYYNEKFASWKPGDPVLPEHAYAATEYGRINVPTRRAESVAAARGDVGYNVRVLSDPNASPEERTQAQAVLVEHAKQRGRGAYETSMAHYAPDVVQRRVAQQTQVATALNPVLASRAGMQTKARLEAELSEDGEGNALLTRLQQARLAGQPLPPGVQTEVREWADVVRVLNTLQKEFSPQDIAQYVGYWNRPASQLNALMQSDQKFLRFLTLNEYLRSTAFYRGGKQLTPFEASVVFGYTPDGREIIPGYYEQKVRGLREIANYQTDSVLRLGTLPRAMLTPENLASGAVLPVDLAPQAPAGWQPVTIPRGQMGAGMPPPAGSPRPQPRIGPTPPPQSADPMEGKTATNPKTGQKLIRRNGRWEPTQ